MWEHGEGWLIGFLHGPCANYKSVLRQHRLPPILKKVIPAHDNVWRGMWTGEDLPSAHDVTPRVLMTRYRFRAVFGKQAIYSYDGVE